MQYSFRGKRKYIEGRARGGKGGGTRIENAHAREEEEEEEEEVCVYSFFSSLSRNSNPNFLSYSTPRGKKRQAIGQVGRWVGGRFSYRRTAQLQQN